jgi:hypothetical protein
VVDIQIVAASVGSGSVEAVLAGMRILAQGIVSYCFSVHKDEVEMFNMVGHSFWGCGSVVVLMMMLIVVLFGWWMMEVLKDEKKKGEEREMMAEILYVGSLTDVNLEQQIEVHNSRKAMMHVAQEFDYDLVLGI